jgi:hypothetical protein
MTFNSRDARAIAKKLQASLKNGRDHELARIYYDGKLVAQFGIRRSSKDVGHDFIPGQIHVTRNQARLLADCPMSFEEWVSVMKGRGLIDDSAGDTENGPKNKRSSGKT